MELIQQTFLEVGLTGLNTRVDDLMTVMLKTCALSTLVHGEHQIITPRLVDRMHIVLHDDQNLPIESIRARVLD